MKTRNLTITLPIDLVTGLEALAAQRDTSISALISDTLTGLVAEETGYQIARESMLADLRRGFRLDTDGRIGWPRDILHVREAN